MIGTNYIKEIALFLKSLQSTHCNADIAIQKNKEQEKMNQEQKGFRIYAEQLTSKVSVKWSSMKE